MPQDRETFIAQIEKARREMHEHIDREFDYFLLHLGSEDMEAYTGEPSCIQRTLPLNAPPAFFKGQKPVSVTFADGRTVDVPTWKKTVIEIMKECNDNPVMHERLMSIRGKVMGKQRTILDASPDGMDVPLKIDEELYLEGKYDTETLIYVTTNRVLRAVGYNYSNINITFQPHQLTIAQPEHEEPSFVEEGVVSIELQM